MADFKGGKKDVLVATDVASKGLDFPEIQHVINFDMPDDIENYGTFWQLLLVELVGNGLRLLSACSASDRTYRSCSGQGRRDDVH